MSLKISSSFAGGRTGCSETGSPMCSCTRVVTACVMSGSPRASVGEDLAVVLHHFLDEMRAADDALALRDQVLLLHVEEVVVGRAAVELDARFVGVLDEVVDRLRRPRLDEELLRHALLHQP